MFVSKRRDHRRRRVFLLYEAHRLSTLPFPHLVNEKFFLVNKDPGEGRAGFQVEKRDIPLLSDVLRVPPVFQYRNGIASLTLKFRTVYRSSVHGMLK